MTLRFAPTMAAILGALQVALVAALAATACPAAAGGAASPGDRIHPALRSGMEIGPPERIVPIWVFFRDRAFPDEMTHQDALRAAQDRIGPAALARRAGIGAALADDADLPPAQSYVEAVRRFGTIRHESRWLNAVSADVPLGQIPDLAALPFVSRVRPVAAGHTAGIGPARGPDGRLLERPDPARVVSRPSMPVAPQAMEGELAVQGAPGTPIALTRTDYGPSYGQLNEIGVIPAHAAGYTGARVILEMIDTGFRKDHQAFGLARTRIVGEHDFVFGDGQTQNEALDDLYQHWHGTATWSTSGGFSRGAIVGPAYGSSFVLAKTEDIRSETEVEEDNYVAALEWGDSLGVQVTSASLVYTTFDDGFSWTWDRLNGDTAPITRALDRAAARGILCVNAAGNYGPDPETFGEPADADTMVACGAVDSTNVIARFSSRGPTVDGRTKPEIVARGVDTWSADANGADTYGPASGTSLSTPLVGGACAVVLEAHPEWSAFRARAALMTTADRVSHPDNDYGFGRINVWAAIQQSPVVVPTPFSLASPQSGDSVPGLLPTFIWHPSRDPRGGAIAYELWIDDAADFSSPVVYSGIADTVFTVPTLLVQDTVYNWRVVGEETHGYRRLCREDRMFRTPVSADTNGLPPNGAGWRIEAKPNPYRGGTCTLAWFAPQGSAHEEVTISILDPAGRRLVRGRQLVSREGWNTFRWDGRSGEGEDVPSGIYLVVLQASGRTAKAKVVLTR